MATTPELIPPAPRRFWRTPAFRWTLFAVVLIGVLFLIGLLLPSPFWRF